MRTFSHYRNKCINECECYDCAKYNPSRKVLAKAKNTRNSSCDWAIITDYYQIRNWLTSFRLCVVIVVVWLLIQIFRVVDLKFQVQDPPLLHQSTLIAIAISIRTLALKKVSSYHTIMVNINLMILSRPRRIMIETSLTVIHFFIWKSYLFTSQSASITNFLYSSETLRMGKGTGSRTSVP